MSNRGWIGCRRSPTAFQTHKTSLLKRIRCQKDVGQVIFSVTKIDKHKRKGILPTGLQAMWRPRDSQFGFAKTEHKRGRESEWEIWLLVRTESHESVAIGAKNEGGVKRERRRTGGYSRTTERKKRGKGTLSLLGFVVPLSPETVDHWRWVLVGGVEKDDAKRLKGRGFAHCRRRRRRCDGKELVATQMPKKRCSWVSPELQALCGRLLAGRRGCVTKGTDCTTKKGRDCTSEEKKRKEGIGFLFLFKFLPLEKPKNKNSLIFSSLPKLAIKLRNQSI